ncbi:MAG TPA: hypothetical protein VFH85_09360 [Gammaproteobacteria bacterium]|nr:hypothetical protein [Gammaproteobacteria bacterium]
MTKYSKLAGVALAIALLAGCSSMSGMFSSSSSKSSDSASASASAQPAKAEDSAPEDSFLASDDYTDEDEVVGKFLKDPDYAKMTEDFELQGADFDWGWAAPNLKISKYSTVHLTVKNDSKSLNPNIKQSVDKSFTAAMKRLGLKAVSSRSRADLELGLDVVDYNPNRTYAFVTMVEPFIEIELRLTNRKTGKDLLLIRNQDHASTPEEAAGEYAGELVQALR